MTIILKGPTMKLRNSHSKLTAPQMRKIRALERELGEPAQVVSILSLLGIDSHKDLDIKQAGEMIELIQDSAIPQKHWENLYA